MTQDRAQEIISAIHASRWGWQGTIDDRYLTDAERKEVNEKWDTMPGHTCWADALYRLSRGE